MMTKPFQRGLILVEAERFSSEGEDIFFKGLFGGKNKNARVGFLISASTHLKQVN